MGQGSAWPSVCEALGSIPSITHTQIKIETEKQGGGRGQERQRKGTQKRMTMCYVQGPAPNDESNHRGL